MRMKGKKIIFSRFDVMDLDYALAKVINAGLIEYKKQMLSSHVCSLPSPYLTVLGEEGVTCLEIDDEKACEDAFNRWVSDLDELIWRFSDEGMDEYPSSVKTDDEQKAHVARRKNAMAIFVKVFDCLWF